MPRSLKHLAGTLGLLLLGVPPGSGATLYVAPGGSNVPPYSSWTGAATNIQTAIDLAVDGDLVLVSNTTYQVGAEVSVAKAITLEGSGNPSDTILDGGFPGRTNRCLFIDHPAAMVRRFTITRGCGQMGGGVHLSDGGTIEDCIISNNTTSLLGGGGAYINLRGTVRRCVFTANRALNGADGGGLYCLLGNRISDCRITANSARVGGGAVIMYDNRVENCIVVSNSADQAGGVFVSQSSVLMNLTVSGNTAVSGGGVNAFFGGTVVNSIVWGNTAPTGSNWTIQGSADNSAGFRRTCTTPALPLPDNLTGDPGFQDAAQGDFRLTAGSPCIDAGDPEGAPSTDIDGQARPVDGDLVNGPWVDIGAYEYVP